MMDAWQWVLDLPVCALLAVTLLRARRLERALAALQQDRGGLEALIGEFDSSTRQAQGGIERLRATAEAGARRLEQQTAAALALRDDMAFLVERGEQVAERLDHGVRAGRTQVQALPPVSSHEVTRLPAVPSRDLGARDNGRHRSQAERDLLAALQAGR